MKDILIDLSINLLVGIVTVVLVLTIVMASLGFIISYAIAGVGILSITGVASIFSSIAVCSGVIIAILAFTRDRERLAREREENRSKILLDQSKYGLDEVLELLKDKNNNRDIWVRAARVLLDATSLGKQIKASDYIKAYRLYEDKMRSELYRALTLYNEDTQEREPLPPQFFYGIREWRRNISLDNAAIEASAKVCVGEVTIDQVIQESSLRQLAPKSVVAIFDFLEYPNDYIDPLKSIQLWIENWESSLGPSQGAKRYVAHAETTSAFDGELFKK